MASIINAGLVLLTMLLLASLFEDLPSAALGAVIIDAMLGLITFAELRRYYRVNRADWVFFMGAMGGILLLGITQGIPIGIVLSLLLLIARSSRPSIRTLGLVPGSQAYLDADGDLDVETTPGVLALRLDWPLFFADANRFRDEVRALARATGDPLRAVVIDADAISLTDTDGADILVQLAADLRAVGATLSLARVQPPILELWVRAGVVEACGGRVFRTVHEAVEAVVAEAPAPRVPAGGR
jgi:SulP family sulfate permease